jgi:hypothetical protein
MSAPGSGKRKDFTYSGQGRGEMPRDVTRVKVHPSDEEFPGGGAFRDCTSLEVVVIPPSVRVIGHGRIDRG